MPNVPFSFAYRSPPTRQKVSLINRSTVAATVSASSVSARRRRTRVVLQRAREGAASPSRAVARDDTSAARAARRRARCTDTAFARARRIPTPESPNAASRRCGRLAMRAGRATHRCARAPAGRESRGRRRRHSGTRSSLLPSRRIHELMLARRGKRRTRITRRSIGGPALALDSRHGLRNAHVRRRRPHRDHHGQPTRQAQRARTIA